MTLKKEQRLRADEHEFRTRVMIRLRQIGFTASMVGEVFNIRAPRVSTLAPISQKSAEDRFDESYMPEPNSGCWLWIGLHDRDDYGRFFINGRTMRAHRVSYERFVAPISDGMVIDHICRVRCCVNPQHMRVVTNAENVLCGEGRTARQARQTHCVHGHSLEGCYVSKAGFRMCRSCHADRERARRLKCA